MSVPAVDGRLVDAARRLRAGQAPADADLVAGLLEAIAPLAPWWHEPYAAPWVPAIEAAVRVAGRVNDEAEAGPPW